MFFRKLPLRLLDLGMAGMLLAACSRGPSVRDYRPTAMAPSAVPSPATSRPDGVAVGASVTPSAVTASTSVTPPAVAAGATRAPVATPAATAMSPSPAPVVAARPAPPARALPTNILIADRGNNRIIEVTPDKQIVWTFQFAGLRPGFGADDAFFAPGNQTIIANLELMHTIVEIDYATKQIIWQYGTPGRPGTGPNQLNTPDDAYRLPDGTTAVADIKNCRILFVGRDKRVVKQYGQTRRCGGGAGFFNKPNGDTPLPQGHLLITEIGGSRISEVDAAGRRVWSFRAPVAYPSDAQMTVRGTIILADYSRPGAILELTRDGKVLWKYRYPLGLPRALDRPSLATELPNGNIIANDDFSHRVIVIDKATKAIVWQYGVAGHAGMGAGELNIPDGLDWRH